MIFLIRLIRKMVVLIFVGYNLNIKFIFRRKLKKKRRIRTSLQLPRKLEDPVTTRRKDALPLLFLTPAVKILLLAYWECFWVHHL